MTTVDTNISYGYLPLLEIFAKANNLEVNFVQRNNGIRAMVSISYDENSDTALSITMLSMKHSGFLNMLDDFLIKCGVDPRFISVGNTAVKKSDEQMEKDWQEHRKKIGLR